MGVLGSRDARERKGRAKEPSTELTGPTGRDTRSFCGIVRAGTCAHSHVHLCMHVFEGLKVQDLAHVRQAFYHGVASLAKPSMLMLPAGSI